MDIISYIMGLIAGKIKGKSVVILDGSSYTCTDDGQGNITIEEA